jgi:hypothetical protein
VVGFPIHRVVPQPLFGGVGMLKGKFAVLSLVAGALLCWQVAGVSTVNSGIVDPCNSTASSAGGVHFMCPQGDGDALGAAVITVTIHDNTNAPVPGIPGSDFWLIGCNDLIALCGGSGSINADAATDAAGMTTISGDVAGGGCDTGVRVVCQGIVLGSGGACTPICLAIAARSPDQKSTTGGPADLQVTNSDFAFFGSSFPTGGPLPGGGTKPYFACHDFVPNGAVTVADFAKFGTHWQHKC